MPASKSVEKEEGSEEENETSRFSPGKKKQNLNKKFRTFLWARVVRRTDPPDRPVFIWCMTNTLVFSVFLQTAIPLLTKGTKTANTKPATPRRI